MNADEKQRIWEHRQNLNSDFNNSSNFFLLAQSFLVSTAAASFGTKTGFATLLPVLGLVITAFWVYVQAKQRNLLGAVKRLCAQELPEYQHMKADRKNSHWPFSNTMLLTFCLPGAFAITWIVMLIAQ